MRWRQIMVAAGIALASANAAADDPTIEDFNGSWRGAEIKISGDEKAPALTSDDLDVQIKSVGSGFQISWTGLARQDGGGLERQRIEARFSPTERPGVYAFEPGGSSFFKLFASPSTGNPLEGETLLWARLAGPTLTVYSLAIDVDGGFDLDRYGRTLSDGGMDIDYTHRMENDRTVTIDGRIEAAGD